MFNRNFTEIFIILGIILSLGLGIRLVAEDGQGDVAGDRG